jgi:alpha-aminoadipate/glutamate carrier protein LysW
LRIAGEEGEWGVGSKKLFHNSPLPIPHSLLHPQSLPNPVSLV